MARRRPSDLHIEGYTFRGVTEFTYLGANVSSENNVGEDITKRIIAGNRAYFSLTRLFHSHLLSKKTKMKMYKTRVFERKIARRIYGPVCVDGQWRQRSNNEMDDILEHGDIVIYKVQTNLMDGPCAADG